MTSKHGDEWIELLGLDAFVQLAQAFGGTRLYVPQEIREDHEIVSAIGLVAAKKLRDRYAPDYIKVPLARDRRALHYRATGFSNPKIARKMGITEGGVDKIFRRLRRRGEHVPQRPAERLLEALGEPALLDLAVKFGGTLLDVPMDANSAPAIIEAIGLERASTLCTIYGGRVILIPAFQRLCVERLLADAVDHERVASIVGVSLDYVRRLANGYC